MLIDQGFETMEGASGDDWIACSQSMRAYMRFSLLGGIIGDQIRNLGYGARVHTVMDGEVLQPPLLLLAGLGEVSRIVEVILNPFLCPRLKSGVITTDMPLRHDQPIDFGLQSFCNQCNKCARECPSGAITAGPKRMFNGYEIWKSDSQKCTQYRVTQAAGAMCGRCMKTCPLNKVVDADGSLMTRIASWCGINAMFLKPLLVPIGVWLDDVLQNGKRNPLKKWWFDHEIIDGITVEPKAGTNQRDIDPSHKIDPEKQKMAYYHANMMPAPDASKPEMVDRKAALAAKDLLETPDEARARAARGEAAPAHYAATPPSGAGIKKDRVISPYATTK